MRKFYDFIEIGTSDFNTLIQMADDCITGLSIDPVAEYLDRLPSPANCIKLNAGISNEDGELKVFYLSPQTIEGFGLPNELRGCSSVGQAHPMVLKVLDQKKLSTSLISVSEVPVYRLRTVIKNFNIDGVYHLKVDTEGHEFIILDDFFQNMESGPYPYSLLFETNSLSDPDKIHHLIARLIMFAYDIAHSETGGGETDTHLKLNIKRIKNRAKFTSALPGYYLTGYPRGYDPKTPPHDNSLEDAQCYSKHINSGGVTYQYGRYEVRDGQYLMNEKNNHDLVSWVLWRE